MKVSKKRYEAALKVVEKYNQEQRNENDKLFEAEKNKKKQALIKEDADISEFDISVRLYNAMTGYFSRYHEIKYPYEVKYSHLKDIDIDKLSLMYLVGPALIKELKSFLQ